MIAIIDYGLGNVKAFANVFNKLNTPYIIARDKSDLKKASKLILPGVGSFDFAMQSLDSSGMKEDLDDLVLNRNLPLLGVCVGMQMLALSSEEGKLPGLGWIDGNVKKFDPDLLENNTMLPHMGWNDVISVENEKLFSGIDSDSQYYFLHSYYFHCNRKENILALTDYGMEFASAVKSKNIFGVQFHPEKSHHWGVQLLKNFSTL